jgi:hypothetical protein
LPGVPDVPKRQMSPLARMRLLPPVEYDYPYTGKLNLSRMKTPDEVKAACPTANFLATPAACARATIDKSQCWVYMLEDDALIALGYDVDVVYRHEMGHCNGWLHK